MSQAEAPEPFDEWAIVELMGHVRLAGHLTEQQIAGGYFLRLDIHGETGPAIVTQLIPPPPGGPVYRITPVTEEIARKVGARSVPAPVTRFDLEPPGAAPARAPGEPGAAHAHDCWDDDCTGECLE